MRKFTRNGGQVRRAGEVPFRKSIIVLQAIDGAGDRNDFGSRNLFPIWDGKQYCLDFTNLCQETMVLGPGDSIHVGQKDVLGRWKDEDAIVTKLIE